MSNNKGVTLMILVITIIILSILSGVSITAGSKLIKEVRISRIVTNMELVKAKAEDIYEEYQFDSTGNVLVGTIDTTIPHLSDTEKTLIETKKGVSNIDSWKWYRWDSTTLANQGLDSNMLESTEYYYINYENGEILYSFGTESNNIIYYSYTGLNALIND